MALAHIHTLCEVNCIRLSLETMRCRHFPTQSPPKQQISSLYVWHCVCCASQVDCFPHSANAYQMSWFDQDDWPHKLWLTRKWLPLATHFRVKHWRANVSNILTSLIHGIRQSLGFYEEKKQQNSNFKVQFCFVCLVRPIRLMKICLSQEPAKKWGKRSWHCSIAAVNDVELSNSNLKKCIRIHPIQMRFSKELSRFEYKWCGVFCDHPPAHSTTSSGSHFGRI